MPTIKVVPMPGIAIQGPTGPQGPQGEAATTGDIEFSGNNITAHGDMTIGVDVVPGVINVSAYAGVNIQTHQNFGLYVNGIEPDNKVVTVADLASVASAPTEVSYIVTGGAHTTQPTFNGAPLFSGSYVEHGDLVHFRVSVLMTNITNFGQGQYYVDLPIISKYDWVTRAGHIHDQSTGKNYGISGHVEAGTYRLNLYFTDTNGQDSEFDYNSPITLSQADTFHISGSYIKGVL